jgi:hypothetical protein
MDEELKALVDRVCKSPIKSPERQKAVNRLLIKLQRLPGLRQCHHPDYLEALDRTWEWLSGNICQTFNPIKTSFQESLTTWINGYLYWRIKDLKPPQHHLSLDDIIRGSENLETYLNHLPDNSQTLNLSGLDIYLERIKKQQAESIVFKLELYIEEDPEEKLRSCHPRQYPDCHCQLLAQRLYLKNPPDRLADLSRELGINDQNLRYHWKNKCQPLLQEIARSLGYSPEKTL